MSCLAHDIAYTWMDATANVVHSLAFPILLMFNRQTSRASICTGQLDARLHLGSRLHLYLRCSPSGAALSSWYAVSDGAGCCVGVRKRSAITF